jgi:hypothetical protein
MLATRRHKAVDQVPGCGSDLGSSAELTRLTIRLRSDAHSGEPSKEVNANAGLLATSVATQALLPGTTGRHQMKSVPQLSSQDGSERVQAEG